jgi:hypothetical protein
MTTAMIGVSSGRVTRRKICQGVAPSSAAASTSDCGIVCSPASSEIATKAEEVDRRVDQAPLHQDPGDDRELAVENPPEGERRQHRGHHVGQEDHGAEEVLEAQVLVQEHRQPQAEPELRHRGDDGVEERVEDREPEHRVVGQPKVVLQPHEDSRAPDPRVGEAEPDAEAERVGQEAEKEDRGGQHEHQPEAVPALGDASEEPVPARACHAVPPSEGRRASGVAAGARVHE